MIALGATVFLASSLGSLHCVGMCGCFVAMLNGSESKPQRAASLGYHAGRLVVYTTLGALAGALGAGVELASWGNLGGLAAWLAGGLMVLWGLGQLLQINTGNRLLQRMPPIAQRGLRTLLTTSARQPPLTRGVMLGFATTLLPCGWLYGFVAAAAGTGSPWLGAWVMAAFWAGTVPALLGAGWGLGWARGWLRPRLRVVMAMAIIVMGFAVVWQRTGMALGPSAHAPAPCHHASVDGGA